MVRLATLDPVLEVTEHKPQCRHLEELLWTHPTECFPKTSEYTRKMHLLEGIAGKREKAVQTGNMRKDIEGGEGERKL